MKVGSTYRGVGPATPSSKVVAQTRAGLTQTTAISPWYRSILLWTQPYRPPNRRTAPMAVFYPPRGLNMTPGIRGSLCTQRNDARQTEPRERVMIKTAPSYIYNKGREGLSGLKYTALASECLSRRSSYFTRLITCRFTTGSAQQDHPSTAVEKKHHGLTRGSYLSMAAPPGPDPIPPGCDPGHKVPKHS